MAAKETGRIQMHIKGEVEIPEEECVTSCARPRSWAFEAPKDRAAAAAAAGDAERLEKEYVT